MNALLALVALPAAAAAIALLLRSPLALRLVARPTGDRWHTHATPSFGGVGIAAGIAAGLALAYAGGALGGSRQLAGLVGALALLFVAGALDDVLTLPPLAKLAAQIGAAALVIGGGIRVEVVQNDAAAWALGVLWLVAMTNALNLLDNMDGLAASLAGVACFFFAVDAVTIHPDSTSLVVAIAVGAACAGFLPFNLRPRRPAAVFMGDSGSQILGLAVGALAMTTSWKVAESTVATLLLPLLVLAVPILDTALVTVMRIVEGRPVHRGGRDHTSHRLVYHGLSEKRTVVLLAVISAGLGGTSLAYQVLDDTRITLIGVLVTFAALVQFAGFLAGVETQEPGRAARTGGALRGVLVHRRRLAELVIDFALVGAAFTAAYLLRVDGSGTIAQRSVFHDALPVVLAARLAAFIPFGLYRSVWRYAGAQDAARVLGAVAVSELVAFGYLTTRTSFQGFALDIFLIDALLCALLVGAARFAERAIVRVLAGARSRGARRRVLVVGAGRAGRSLVRELRETPGELVVGFVDDDPRLRRRRLLAVPVVGATGELGGVLERTRPDAVLVTIPDADEGVLAAVREACAAAGVGCRMVRRQILDVEPLAPVGVAAE